MTEPEPDEPQFWRDVEEAFSAVCAVAGPQRAAAAEARCAGRPRLRREVEALIAADSEAGAFLEPGRLGDAAASFVEPDPRLGQTLSHYRILSEISRGGMGIVYQALDLDLGREVALKVLPPALVADRERLRRFVQEARAAAMLEHPHVAGIHEIGEASGTTFIAMELIRGETLAAVLGRERLSLGRVLALAVEVAEGLAHAHGHGIVHRDLKPGNIMLSADDHVRIIDFSLAKLTRPDGSPGRGSAATDAGRVMGTPAYMSPEQARGAEVDRRSDIFSFGIVLFEMLAGAQPFKGESDVETLHAILEAPTPPLPRAPAELQRLLERCLAKAVSERHQSMQDVVAELRAVQACVERPAVPRRRRRMLWRFVGFCAPAAVVLGLAAREQQATSTPRAHSLVVLPFAAASPELQYVADGLTEALINQLSQVPALHVVARATAFQRRGRHADAPAVARELGVAQVVTGRLARANDVTSLQVDLIESRSGTQLWGRSYRLTPTELADCERAVAETLAAEMGLPGSLPGPSLSGRDPQAHELYLQGRFFWNKRTGEGLRRGIELFRAALARDPGYAAAWSGLADAWALLPEYGGARESEAYPQARQAAEKALELDGRLAEARTSLAFVRFWWDRAWPEAEQEFQRALQLNPGYATAHHWYGNALLAMGRTSEGVVQLEQAQRSDPLSLVVGTELGAGLYLARRYDEAAARLDRTLELDERFLSAHGWSGDVALAANRTEDARRHFERARSLSGRPAAKLAKLGLTELRGGNAALARRYLQRLDELDPRHDVAYDRAILLAGLGERKAALGALEQAFEECSSDLAFIGLDPLFDPLRREARFTELVRRLGRSGPSAASPWPSPGARLWASAREVR